MMRVFLNRDFRKAIYITNTFEQVFELLEIRDRAQPGDEDAILCRIRCDTSVETIKELKVTIRQDPHFIIIECHPQMVFTDDEFEMILSQATIGAHEIALVGTSDITQEKLHSLAKEANLKVIESQ